MPPTRIPDAAPDANLHTDHHVLDQLFFFFLDDFDFPQHSSSMRLGGVLWVSLLQFSNARRALHAIQLGTAVMTILFTLYERCGGSSLRVMS